MKHTPYGYRIENGKALIVEEEAETIHRIIKNYLGGMSLASTASAEGLSHSHAWVKKLITNRKYLGDDFYPQILTEEEITACEEEIQRRYCVHGIAKRGRRKRVPPKPETEFVLLSPRKFHADPRKQAEYMYGLVKEKVIK